MKQNENDNGSTSINDLEKRVEKLENIIDDFMDNWGPGVQKKRENRDKVWDEMVRVLTIQNREEAENNN
mgnify:CR=1 FL=1